MRTNDPHADLTLLREYEEFSQRMVDSKKPSPEEREFLEEVYAIAQKRIHKEQSGANTKKVGRSQVAAYQRASQIVSKALARIEIAQKACVEASGTESFKWEDLFGPGKSALTRLESALRQMENEALGQLHAKFLEPDEEPEFKPLFRIGYDLNRFGSKPAATWFLINIDQLLRDHPLTKNTTQKYRHEVISRILDAAFSEHLQEPSIKAELSRLKKRRQK